MAHVRSGVRDPDPTTPRRVPGSLRRTSHVDMATARGVLTLSSAARDLLTGPDGGTTVLGLTTLAATVDATGCLVALTSGNRPVAEAEVLVGRHVGKGFRAALDEALPEERAAHSLLYLLLEELPVARLISGYASLYRHPVQTSRDAPMLPADICAGWRHDGLMMTAIADSGVIPIPVGPPAPATPGGDGGWHPMDPMAPGTMRRKRLVDVTADGAGGLAVGAMFRDTHVEPDGTETVLHEYQVAASLDDAGTVRSCTATPRVLPWPECPAAAASAGRLVGHPVDAIRALVRTELTGVTTCTHLNDLLRSLGDVGALADALSAQLGQLPV